MYVGKCLDPPNQVLKQIIQFILCLHDAYIDCLCSIKLPVITTDIINRLRKKSQMLQITLTMALFYVRALQATCTKNLHSAFTDKHWQSDHWGLKIKFYYYIMNSHTHNLHHFNSAIRLQRTQRCDDTVDTIIICLRDTVLQVNCFSHWNNSITYHK